MHGGVPLMGKRPPVKARLAATCPFCGEHIARGDRIRAGDGGWVHARCAAEAQRRDAILRGDTYRAGAGSTWKRR